MPQPPATAYLSRELVRFIPFAAQRTFVNAALGNGATFVAEFDVALRVSDVNQLLTGAFPGGGTQPPVAVGPFLDALAFSAGAGSITVDYAVDRDCSYRQIAATVVPAGTATNISGLRITGRFVRITYTNTSGGAALAEFGAYVRST
jgi:hypothetical protein